MHRLKDRSPKGKFSSFRTLILIISLMGGTILFTGPEVSAGEVTLGYYAGLLANQVCPGFNSPDRMDACKAYLHYRIDQYQSPVNAQEKCRNTYCAQESNPYVRSDCESVCDTMNNNDT